MSSADDHSATPGSMSWALLLAKWTEWARASVALPATAEGDRWRAAMAPIIGLQAVTMALGETETLDERERAVGLDRAEILIRRHAAALHELWRGEPLPVEMDGVIGDAREALRGAKERGLEWFVKGGSVEVGDPTSAVDGLIEAGFTGDLWLARPGTRLGEGALAAYVRPSGAEAEAIGVVLIAIFSGAGEARRTPCQRQAYRLFDQDPPEDVVVPMDETLPAGAPILEPWIEGGVRTGRFDAEAAARWAAAQRDGA